MTQQDKVTNAVVKILQQTQDGTLAWKPVHPSHDLTSGTEDVVETVYLAQKGDRLLRLYPYKSRYYLDDCEYHWEDHVALELSDKSRTTWWRFPGDRVIWDILEAVKFKTAGVEGFIDDLLSE